MSSFWTKYWVTEVLSSAEIPGASILEGIYINDIFPQFLSNVHLSFIHIIMAEMSKVQLSFSLCVKEARNYVSLHLTAGSNNGGFVQYFKMDVHLSDPTVSIRGPQL